MEPLTMIGLGFGASALGGGLQGYFGGKGAERAAQIQSQGADKSRALLEKFYGQAMGTQQPYLQAGGQGLDAFSQRALGGGFRTDVPQFQNRQFNLEADPGFQFRLQQGTQAINRGAAARGGSLGGGVMKELSRYGQGLASDEAQNAYGRFSNERGFDYGMMGDTYNRQVQQQGIDANMLAQLMGVGQQAAGNVSNLATGLGGALGDIELQRANSLAAGKAGQYNALGGFLGGLGSNVGGLFNMGAMGAFNQQPSFNAGGGIPTTSANNFAQPRGGGSPFGNMVQPNYTGYTGSPGPTPNRLMPQYSWER